MSKAYPTPNIFNFVKLYSLFWYLLDFLHYEKEDQVRERESNYELAKKSRRQEKSKHVHHST